MATRGVTAAKTRHGDPSPCTSGMVKKAGVIESAPGAAAVKAAYVLAPPESGAPVAASAAYRYSCSGSVPAPGSASTSVSESVSDSST